ncbi:MAG: hypothetical protein M1829_003626 [Trizodia sp. TS-e1964]|nr:MAG: hypothetical protein M1829_003626 [Trizodia sp. TS-e1964]
MHFPTILFSLYMLIRATAALPRHAASIVSDPSVFSPNILLTPRTLPPSESSPGSGLSADFISRMDDSQLEKLRIDISTAFLTVRETQLNEEPVGGKLTELKYLILILEGSKLGRDRIATIVASKLQDYDETVSKLPDSDASVVAMKEFFAKLRPEDYPPTTS